jgi:hypothetical protein
LLTDETSGAMEELGSVCLTPVHPAKENNVVAHRKKAMIPIVFTLIFFMFTTLSE